MSGLELLVVGVAALAGYWLVSFLLKERKPPAAKAPASEGMGAGTKSEAGQESEEAPGDWKSDRQPKPLRWEEVLGVSSASNVEEIRGAYQRLLSQYHPDKVASLGPDLRDLANRKSQEITQAYRSAMAARGEQS